jgi:hypothetical protein
METISKRDGLHFAPSASNPGLILGQRIWQFFDKPENLIYVEALSDNNEILLVIVRQGSVYRESKIAARDLQEELDNLATGDEPYLIRVCGEVTFRFPDRLVTSFDQVPDSVFNHVSSTIESKPRPADVEVSEQKSHLPMFIIGIIMIILFGGYSALHSLRFLPTNSQYADYNRALYTAAPSEQLANFSELVKALYFIPGWKVSGLKMQDGEYLMTMQANGGNLEWLSRFSKQNNFTLNATGDAVLLTREIALKNRPIPAHIYPLKAVVSIVVDEVDTLLHANAIQLGNTEQRGAAAVTPITLTLNNATPEMIDLLGREIEHLPLQLTAIDISFKDGLINGSIQFLVWGSEHANG